MLLSELVAQGYQAFVISSAHDEGGFMENLYIAMYEGYPNGLDMIPLSEDYRDIVPAHEASRLLCNQEAVAWIQNHVEGEVPPLITPEIGIGEGIDIPDEMLSIDGDDEYTEGGETGPSWGFGLFNWTNGFKPPSNWTWILLLAAFILFFKRKRKKKKK